MATASLRPLLMPSPFAVIPVVEPSPVLAWRATPISDLMPVCIALVPVPPLEGARGIRTPPVVTNVSFVTTSPRLTTAVAAAVDSSKWRIIGDPHGERYGRILLP